MRGRLERVKRFEQGLQARDAVLQELLSRVEVPLPESVVAAEIDARMHNFSHQLENAKLTLEDYLAREERTREDFDAEAAKAARDTVKSQFVLDAIALKEQLGVTQAELTEQVVQRARNAGMDAQEYANALMRGNQLPALAAEVVRAKALAIVLERAAITDASGREVDLSLLNEGSDGSEGSATDSDDPSD